MDKNILQEILVKLFSGKSTSDEINQINNWYDSFDIDEEITVEDYKRRSKAVIKQVIFRKIKNKSGMMRSRNYKQFNFFIYAVAASICLGFFAVTWFITFPSSKQSEKDTFVSFENGIGMIKTVKLPDGSSVLLHHNSSINVSKDFINNRHVLLEGTAFFDVMPDSNSPFTIQTKTLQTTVLGTSFTIVNSPIQGEKVAVKTGKVNVFSPQYGEVNLVESQSVKLNECRLSKQSNIDPKMEFGWTEKALVFDHTDMISMINEIENWYGVKVSSDCEKYPKRKISGIYKDMSLEELLTTIKFSIPLKFKIHKQNVQINFLECQ